MLLLLVLNKYQNFQQLNTCEFVNECKKKTTREIIKFQFYETIIKSTLISQDKEGNVQKVPESI